MTQVDKQELPEGLRWVKIGDIAEVATGGTPSTTHPEYYGGSINWLKSGDVKGVYVNDVPNRITEEGLNNSNARVHPVGTVVLAMSGQGKTRGTSAILKIPSACSQSVAAILPSSIAIPEIIHFALVAQYSEVRRLTGDNERTGLNLGRVRDIHIPLPPLPEQQRITAILGEQMAAVDKARAAVEQQLNAAKQLPAAYLREVFESDEAKGWGRKKLGELCEFKNGINFDATQKGIGVLTVDVLNMYSDSITLKMDNLYRVDAKLDDQYYLRENDMLFVRSSVKKEGIGWSALFPGYSERVTFCGFLIRARLTKDILPSFILYYLRQPMIRDWFASSAGQMAITNISQEKLKSIEIPVPSIETQQRIVTHLERQTNETGQLQNSVQTQLDSINQLPAALLRRAFNGEL